MTDGICIVIEVDAGTTITYASEQAIKLARKMDECVKFKFNGCSFWAYPTSSVYALEESYKEYLEQISDLS